MIQFKYHTDLSYFYLKNDILKSPTNNMKSGNMQVIFEFQREKLIHFEKKAYKFCEVSFFKMCYW